MYQRFSVIGASSVEDGIITFAHRKTPPVSLLSFKTHLGQLTDLIISGGRSWGNKEDVSNCTLVIVRQPTIGASLDANMRLGRPYTQPQRVAFPVPPRPSSPRQPSCCVSFLICFQGFPGVLWGSPLPPRVPNGVLPLRFHSAPRGCFKLLT